jgi:hypothetical protein
MEFYARSTSEDLKFTNVSAGAPPFALLDGISLQEVTPAVSQTPEPSNFVLFGSGLLGLVAVYLFRRHSARRSMA